MRWTGIAVVAVAVALTARAQPTQIANFTDFFTVPATYKGLGGWWCPWMLGEVYNRCTIGAWTGLGAQGPQTGGVCGYGIEEPELTISFPPNEYFHQGGASCDTTRGVGSFCESIDTNATRSNGGGGGASGGCWTFNPVSAAVVGESPSVRRWLSRWHAKLRRGRWRCHAIDGGGCASFVPGS